MKPVKWISLIGGVAAVALAWTAAGQAETVLRVSSWAPPTHGINAVVWPTWGKWIEEATQGRVKIKVEYGLGSPPAQPDLIRDGVADVSWIFHGYNPGRFLLTQVVELPGLGTSAEAASVAYWRVYEKYLAVANEHKGLKVIGLTSHGPGIIHTKKPINSLADLKGLKIRIGGGVSGAVGKALGVVGVQVPAPKVYETLAQGVADGIFMPMETKKSFRLKEVTPYSLIMPGGLYYGSFAFIMNPARFASLSKQDQDAILSVSDEKLSRLAGKMWDDADKVGLADAKAAGNTITVADDAMKKRYYEMVAPIETRWLNAAGAMGIDASAALSELRRIARSY